jgi:hypothetical protein
MMDNNVSYINKIADLAVKNSGETDYLAIVNAVTDKEAFALAVSKMDKTVGSKRGDFYKWQKSGYSHSKRAARVFNSMIDHIKTPEARAILEAKRKFLYSVCRSQNIESTQLYKDNRNKFMKQAVKALKAM